MGRPSRASSLALIWPTARMTPLRACLRKGEGASASRSCSDVNVPAMPAAARFTAAATLGTEFFEVGDDFIRARVPVNPRRSNGPGHRLFVDAVLYRYRAGIPWRDLLERFAWCICATCTSTELGYKRGCCKPRAQPRRPVHQLRHNLRLKVPDARCSTPAMARMPQPCLRRLALVTRSSAWSWWHVCEELGICRPYRCAGAALQI